MTLTLFATKSVEPKLRYYQSEAIEAILKSLQTNRSALLVLATGLGKSQCASQIIAESFGRVLFLAHREELVDQMRERLENETGEPIGLERADSRASLSSRIVVASIQSIMQTHRLERFPPGHFSLVVCDEAHNFVSPSFRKPAEYFTGKLLGLTATPNRSDERALGQLFDDVPYVMDILDGIDQGFLVPLKGREIALDTIDLREVHETAGDLSAGELDEEMLRSVAGICKETRRYEPERQGIMFWPGVKCAEFAAQVMNNLLPGSTGFVSGQTDKRERKEMFQAFKSGSLQYISNCNVATEGVDLPAASAIIWGRPTLSRSLYAQGVGRATRVEPGLIERIGGDKHLAAERKAAIAASSKPSSVILDFVGNSRLHSLVGLTDLIGTDFSEAEVKKAKKPRDNGELVDVLGELQKAREEIRRMASAVPRAKVNSTSIPFDPFQILGAIPTSAQTRFGGSPITEPQREKLIKFGMPAVDVEKLTKGEASAMMDKLIARSRKGFSTLNQTKVLGRYGVDASQARFERASKALDYLKQHGWDKNANRETLKQILGV